MWLELWKQECMYTSHWVHMRDSGMLGLRHCKGLQLALLYGPCNSLFSQGLPELLKFWLRSRRKEVSGPLFKHTYPNTSQGIYTDTTGSMEHPAYYGPGWDGEL